MSSSLAGRCLPALCCVHAAAAAAAVGTLWALKAWSNAATAHTASSEGDEQLHAFVTGCGSGIGRETALLLAEKGWQVYAGCQFAEEQQQLKQLHDNITPILLDVTVQESVAAAAEQVRAAVGSNGLQLLVNNAGTCVVGPSEFMPMDTFRHVMEVNLFGAVQVTQAFIPLLRKGPRMGRIINMSSQNGHMPTPMCGAYCASKAALEVFSDCLRYDLEVARQGIAVVLIKPGPVLTPLLPRVAADSAADFERMPAAATEYYGGVMSKLRQQLEKASKKASTPREVAETIFKAASSPRPNPRYHVGSSTTTLYWVKRLLPDNVWDGMLLRSLASK